MTMESKFEQFKQKAFSILRSAHNIDPQMVDAHQYDLILESTLKEESDRVMFMVNRYGTPSFITEVKLHTQDVFMFNEWGLFLLNTRSEMDMSFEEHTYVDPNYFKPNDSKAEVFYHSNLSLVVNNLIVTPGVRTDVFKKYIQVEDRRNRSESGLLEFVDGIGALVGSKNVHFNLDLPRKTSLDGSQIRVRLRLRGLLFRNITELVQTKTELMLLRGLRGMARWNRS